MAGGRAVLLGLCGVRCLGAKWPGQACQRGMERERT